MSSLLMESLGWALLHSLWQGALVALLLAVALATVGRRAANARYALACGALVLTLVLPVVSGWRHSVEAGARVSPGAAPRVASGRMSSERMMREAEPGAASVHSAAWEAEPSPATSGRESSLTGPGLEAPERESPLAWLRSRVERHMRWLVLAWVAGVGLCSGRMTAEWVKLRRLAAGARPAPVEWQERLDALAARLGLRRAVRLLQSAAVDVPAAVGWLSPVVLLPMSALSGLSTRQLEMVLAHELAHIRRHDFTVNLAQVLVETLLFYHPAVRWVSHVIRVEREHCCDDVAVGASGGALSYARALTALEELRVLPQSQGPAMSALGGSLPERVRRLVTAPAARCSSRWVAGASALTLASSLAVAAPLTSLMLGRTESTSQGTRADLAAPDARALPGVAPSPHGDVRRPPAPPAAGVASSAEKNALPAPVPVAATPAPAPKPAPRDSGDADDGLDERTRVGSGQPLTVDQLIALKVAGVTPARVQELAALGYAPTVANLVAMGHAGVTPEYARDMSARFGRKLDADELVQMKHLGVTPAYIESLQASGFTTNDPDDLVQARAVGVDAAYVQALGQRGLSKLPVDDLVQLRALGVTPEWLDRMREAGVQTKDPEELAQLRALGVDAGFIRKLRGSQSQ